MNPIPADFPRTMRNDDTAKMDTAQACIDREPAFHPGPDNRTPRQRERSWWHRTAEVTVREDQGEKIIGLHWNAPRAEWIESGGVRYRRFTATVFQAFIILRDNASSGTAEMRIYA